jgi:hypothetical protein
MTPDAGAEYTRDFDGTPEAARRALRRAAEDWGASLDPATAGAGDIDDVDDIDDIELTLPVVAGLRRGILVGRVRTPAAAAGCRLVLRVERADLRVQKPAVVVLAIAAAGGVAAFLWPFFPQILPVVPLALVLAVAGWLLVVARLRSSGPEDFLASVTSVAASAEPT